MLCSEDTKMNKRHQSCPQRQPSVDDRGQGLEPIIAGFPEVCGCKSRVILVLVEMGKI